ncbi:kinase-like protein [Rhizophagus irregularis]|uniref:Kinase-like protein n=1 Tax=Rhizophagus irregularis TaxID=588596 RepID=A0A2N0S4J8_9GLOM|nr:kinase-like protein [Rhizophagus irregularis]
MNYGLINCKIVESCFKAGGTIIINEQVAKKVLEILDNDNLLNSQEKLEAKKDIIRGLDTYNLKENNDFKYYCNKCNLKGRTNLNCEHCVRNILIENFNKWTSGIMVLDKTIQNSQIDYPLPGHFPEWIPYKDLDDIKEKTRGGFATIFNAKWKKGKIITFSSETDSFLRTGPIPVILKRLPDSYMYDEKSFNELQIHIRASFWGNHAVTLYGVTRDESTNLKNLMLVLRPMVCNLWEFCSERLTWKDVYQAFWFIANGLTQLHSKGLLHRDLHPGNVLIRENQYWLSDFGLSGPPSSSNNQIYGNTPFMAPEVLKEGNYTTASDIYAFGMLMWMIASSSPPFKDYDDEVQLHLAIIEGERPRKILDIPIEYNLLMKRCWNEDPKERPNAQELLTFFTEVITNENEEKYNFLKNYIKEKEDNKYPIQVQSIWESRTHSIYYSNDIDTMSSISSFEDCAI